MPSIAPTPSLYSISFCACFLIFGLIGGGLGPMIPIKAKQMGILETSFSLAFTMKGVGGLIGTVATSKVEKYMSINKAVSLSMLLIALGAYVCCSTLSLAMFNLMFLGIGFSCMVINVGATVVIMRLFTDNKKVESLIKSLHFTFGCGAFLSPLGTSILGLGALNFYAFLGFAMFCVFLFYRDAEQSSAPASAENQTNLLVQNPESASETHNKQIAIPPRLDYYIALIMFFYAGCEVSYGGWVATFGIMQPSISMEQSLFGASLFWMCFTIGRGLAIPLSSYASTTKQLSVLTASLLGAVVFSLVLYTLGKPLAIIYIGSVFFGLFMSGIYPLTMNLTNSLGLKTSTENTALYAFGGSVGEMTLPLLIGLQMNGFGASMLLWNLLIFAIGVFTLFKTSVKMGDQVVSAAHSKFQKELGPVTKNLQMF